MNKKLIASLLTLGLILCPVSGQVGSGSMVSEARADESDYSKVISPSDRIKASIADYEKYKNTNLYRLASKEYKDEIDKVVDLAKEFIGKNSVSDSDLKDISEKLHDASQNLIKSSQSNLYNFKAKILNAEKVLRDNVDKNTTEESKEEFEKIDKIIKDSKVKLKDDQLAKLDGEELEKSTNEILGLLEDAKTHQNFKYENYHPTDEEVKKLDAEINNENGEISEEKLKNLANDVKKLVDSNGDFQNSARYRLADEKDKTAYTTAFDKIKGLTEIDKDNYLNTRELVENVARARKVIEEKDLDLSITKTNRDVNEIMAKFKAHLVNSEKLLENLKDDKLSSDYKEKLALAYIYLQDYEKNIKRSIKDYQDLEAELDKLVEQIKNSKGEGEVRPEDKKKEKIEKLDKLLARVKLLIGTDSYKKGNSTDKKALEDAVKVAEDLINKYKFSESWVSDDELSEAINKLEKAYAKFEKSDDKALIKKLIEDLLKSTEGIRIDQIYGKNEKDAKNAYTKAREAAAKAAKDKNISFADLTKAYENFKDARDKLAEFLTSRLKKLVDDDSNFVDTEKYKEADRSYDAKDVDAILNYRSLIRDSKEELDKISPDANKLDLLYKKLDAARREIEGKLSSQARKLTDAILDGLAWVNSNEYKKSSEGLSGERKKAADKYLKYLKVAEELQKNGKLDSDTAEEILDLINHSRDFIQGKITVEKYLSNYYYHYLKALKNYKNQEEYKNLPQALRDKLDKALELYNKSSDEKAVFSALDAVWREQAIQDIIYKMKLGNNPIAVRDKLLIDLTNLIKEDEKFINDEKYKNAPKELKNDYQRALEEAKKVIQSDSPSDKEVKEAYDRLKLTKNRIEVRSIIDRRLVVLADKFKKNQLKIAGVEARKAIADKINALKANPYTTVEEVDAVEKELDDLINPKFAATTTLTPTNQVQTSTRPVSTARNAGSIVKTGINGIAKVAAVLVVAAIILKLTSKKGDKK